MDVTIEQLEPMRLAAIRHLGPYPQLGTAFRQLGEALATANFDASTGKMVAVTHDDPRHTPESELRSDAGIVLSGEIAVPNGLNEVHLEGGWYAIAIHQGSYEGLPNAWQTFTTAVSKTHRPRMAPCFEMYLNHMGEVPPSELQTQLYMAIEAPK